MKCIMQCQHIDYMSMGKKAEKKRLTKSNRKSKSYLVFDEEARKEWLTSFSKRKKERQQKAKDDLAALLKEEKARQRQEFREQIKKKEAKYLEHMKDVEEVLKERTQSYQCGERTVEITEYNFDDQDDMIGTNKQEEEEQDNSEHEDQQKEGDVDEDSNADSEGEETTSADKPNIPVNKKMPRKMSKVAVKIEKRLNKLNNKRKISKHALNKKRQLAADNTNSRKPSGGKGKFSSNMKSGKRRK